MHHAISLAMLHSAAACPPSLPLLEVARVVGAPRLVGCADGPAS
jgi:hypothetical protein